MAKHEIVIHENTGATRDVAPYLGSYISKETLREAAFAPAVALKSGLTPIQTMALLEGAFEAFAELERLELVRIHTDLGTICAFISGSFPTADAAFERPRNTLQLALRLDDEIKFALTDTAVTVVADESLTKLRVDNVMDLATPRPFNLIHGQAVFRVAGYNMVLDDEGATVFLQDSKGVTYEVVVDRVISKQLFEGHTAALLEPGDYRLVVKSRAGDAEGPLQTAFRKVKYLKVAPPPPPAKPTVTSVTATDGLPFEVGKDFAIRGTGLAEGEIRVGFHTAGVEYEERVLDGYVKSRTDTEIVIDGPESYADMEASCDGFKLMIAGEEVYNF